MGIDMGGQKPVRSGCKHREPQKFYLQFRLLNAYSIGYDGLFMYDIYTSLYTLL